MHWQLAYNTKSRNSLHTSHITIVCKRFFRKFSVKFVFCELPQPDITHTQNMQAQINVYEWLVQNKSSFLPPVCNKMMHNKGLLKVMFVGGPNVRSDYHIEEGEVHYY